LRKRVWEWMAFGLGCIALCFSCPRSLADDPYAQASPAGEVGLIRMEAFIRSDLPAGAQVQAYVIDLQKRVSGLEIVVHDVLKDREQLVRLNELTKKFGRTQAVVPSFYCCNRMYFGFADAAKSGPSIESLLAVDLYVREGCSRCAKAKVFIEKLKLRWPALRFRFHEITADAQARAKWEQLCRGAGQPPGLPTIDFAGHVQVGYVDDAGSGAQFEQLIRRFARGEKANPPKKEPSRLPAQSRLPTGNRPAIGGLVAIADPSAWPALLPGALWSDSRVGQEDGDQRDELPLPVEAGELDEGLSPVAGESTVRDASIKLPLLGTLRVEEWGMPAFTLAVGLVDGFNPCAMWVLVFLLSVLVNIQDRRKIIAIAGTFVLVSGIAYYAFMAAWLNLFMLIGMARSIQILLGLFAIFIGCVNIKDFFAFKQGISLSIPESTKPNLYRRVREIVNAKYLYIAIGGAITLAIVVNVIELLCTAGLPALYTQILTMQQLPAWENYLYLALYIAAYMLDDTLLLAVVVLTLSRRKLQEREGRWLKMVSGLVILLLGAVMILRPDWLQLD
jgi:hypothetical protein